MIMKKHMTLSDVAREAHVAIRTASKVFNGDSTVRPYIKDHVLKIADKLNYRPNPIAQALRVKSLNIISVAIPELEIPFFGSLFQEIYMQFSESNLLVVPCRYIDALNNANNTIYACATIMVTPKLEDVCKLVQKGPVLTIDGIDVAGSALDLASDIAFDFKSAYTEITGKLLGLGKEKIAVYSPLAFGINHAKKFTHVEECLRKAGLDFMRPAGERYFASKAAMVEQCREAKPDAIFCGNDSEALILMQELQRNGIRVPDDILLIGCDGSFSLDSFLWTVAFDTREIARLAVELILAELNTEGQHKLAVYRPHVHAPELPPPTSANRGTPKSSSKRR